MKKKILALSAFVALTAGTSFGQQDKLLTHFMYDKMTINPGSTGIGMKDGVCGTMIYRNQWDKVNGAPNSAVLNVESNLGRFAPVNLGLSVFHDAIGFARQNNAMLNVSYPITTNAGTLGIGVGVGIINFGMDPNWIPPTTAPDPTLPVSNSGTNVDLNGGIFWKGSTRNYFVGISSDHLSESVISNVFYSTARHYNLLAGYRFEGLFGQANNGANRDLDVQMIMRTDMVKFSADINARYMQGNFYGGLTYRTSDAISLMAGFMPMTNFTVGYSYDLTINQLSSISRGTHELVVKYCYFFPPPPVHKSKHPRWL